MRGIQKGSGQPACLIEFIALQMSARLLEDADSWQQFPLEYPPGSKTRELRELLVREQGGLCAYTGVGLDDSRLNVRKPSLQTPPRHDYWFKPHIEHLKPQRQCREELEASGGIVGRDLGDDLNYHNMVAALEVAGMEKEHFGASARKDVPIPVWPTHENCEEQFRFFFEDGRIRGQGDAASQTIKTLRLDHTTLRGWRMAEIETWFLMPESETFPVQNFDDSDVARSPMPWDLPTSQLREILSLMQGAGGGTLPEFAFVIAQLARDALEMQEKLGQLQGE